MEDSSAWIDGEPNGGIETVWEERTTCCSCIWMQALLLKWKPHSRNPKRDFQDALRLKLDIKPNDLPSVCPAKNCYQNITINHAETWAAGVTVSRRHDYIKRILGNYADGGFGIASTVLELMLGALGYNTKEVITGNTTDPACADLSIQDFTHQNSSSFLDICVISPDARWTLNTV